VRRDWGKLSNVLLRVCISSKLNFPPKSCIPRREKMMMKRKRSRSREAMERTEFSKDATKLLREFQYLRTDGEVNPSPVPPPRHLCRLQDGAPSLLFLPGLGQGWLWWCELGTASKFRSSISSGQQ
jgi:hypothetical protein